MTEYYVGKGGSDSNNGTTWALRKLTLNGASGAEKLILSAGDELIIGPGVYRDELKPVDSWVGTSGNEIIIRGDPSGIETDGIGGQIVLTGSDDDQTNTRPYAIDPLSGSDFWIVRNIHFELYSSSAISLATDASDWIIEDCVFLVNGGVSSLGLSSSHLDGGYELRRCVFVGPKNLAGIRFAPTTEQSYGSIIENCLFIGGGEGVSLSRSVGVTIRNCTFFQQGGSAVRALIATTGTIDVNNCIFAGADLNALKAIEIGDIIEDYNTFWGNNSDRSLVDTGSNSETYPPIFELPILLDGYVFPTPLLGTLSERSTLQLAGTSETTEDVFGIVKPTVAAKSSWGAFQQRLVERETTTVYDSSTASLKLPDAGDHQMFVPVDGSEITISVRAYREADYTGTLPTMIVRQPGQSDSSTVDTGAVSTWNLLTDTLTPSSDTDYVVVILRSLNTATSGNYDTFFDSLKVA